MSARFVPRFARLLSVLGLASSLATSPAPAQGFPLATIDGAASGDLLGFGVAGPGDLDGDGVPDLLVCAPQCYWFSPCLGSCGAGAVKVVSGAGGGRLLNLPGAAPGEMFGWSAAGAGDVDADGVPDLVVGAFCAAPSGLADAGRVTVHSGATGLVLRTFDGSAAGDRFGWFVAGVGDVDADGAPDVAAGAPPGNYVKVFSGASGGTLHTLSGFGSFGAVAGAGDLNGDGHAEIAVGAWLAGPGQAFVYSGATGAPIYSFTGSVAGDRFGAALAGVGDVSGDGVPDLAVGAPTASPGGLAWAGQAVVFSGANGVVLRTFDGGAPGDGFGWSLAGPGDLNGDGVGDVLVGAHQTGFGGTPASTGFVRVYSVVTGLPLHTVSGSTVGEAFGRYAAAPGDVNGDGVGDLLVGAHGADPGGATDAGQARAVSVVGIPAGSSLFGSGCPGTGGVVPAISTAGGAPSAATGNRSFAIVLSNARPSSIAVLIVGFSSASWLGIPLPIGLGFLGLPGCSLAVAHDLELVTGTTVDGLEFFPAPIPQDPLAVGGAVFFQWYVVDPGPAPLPGSMSRGLALTL